MDVSGSPCACEDPKARFDVFETRGLGTDALYGESSLKTCKTCGRVWLHYLLEFEGTTGSGRWYRGLLAEGEQVDPAKAAERFAAMPDYLAGGSFFKGQAHRRKGPIDASPG